MKRILPIVITAFIMLSYSVAVSADWSEQSETPLVWGIDRIDIANHTSDGVQKIKILKIDLSNPKLSVKLLTSPSGVSYLSNVRNLANTDERVVAAVNSDFFAWYKNDTSRGSAVGFDVSDGKMLTSPPTDEQLASMVFTTDGKVFTSYFKPAMSVTTAEGRTEKIRNINKYDPLTDLVVYTPAWGKTFSSDGGNLTVATVENGVVTNITKEAGDIEIPQNGYLIAGLADRTDFFTAGIATGSKINLDISFTPDFDNIDTAVGGGTVLIKDGKEAPVTHMRYGRDYRTAAGVSKDGKTLYLIAADGLSGSIGMSLAEMRKLMLSIGVYDGINFDGGGSTQMVARAYGESNLSYINSPENGYYRPVINALGIVVNGTRGVLDGITVSSSESTVRCESKVSVSFKPFDQLYYGVDIDPNIHATYTFEGVKGTADGNSFIPSEKGTLVATVHYGDFSNYTIINVRDYPKYADCDKTIYKVKSGETVPVVINAIDQKGKQYTLPISETAFNVTDGLATLSGNKITAVKSGFGTMTFTIGDLKFSAYLSVDGVIPEDAFAEKGSFTDNFEADNGVAVSYPTATPSAYKISNEQAAGGKTSGKLWFDFNNDITDLQSAYVSFTNPAVIHGIGAALSLDLYSPGYKNSVLKAMFTDANGDIKRITLCGDLSFTGWKNVSIALPDDLSYPAKLSRIYVVENSAGSKERGALYFDNLVLNYSAAGDYAADVLISDNFTPDISVTGGIENTGTILDTAVLGNIAKTLEKSKISYTFDSMTKPSNLISKKVSSADGVTVLHIDSVNNDTLASIENTAVSGKAFAVIIDNFNEIQMNSVNNALSAHLAANKNVFVVFKGNFVMVTNNGGVRYVSLPPLSPSILTNQKTYVSFDLYASGDTVKYKLNRLPLWN
ncbi:MAG: phosphodiester glycosidase family protein [Bacillota bacterium]|nr:phosphodiester glycosidase family protein [Bacillota bacterium]